MSRSAHGVEAVDAPKLPDNPVTGEGGSLVDQACLRAIRNRPAQEVLQDCQDGVLTAQMCLDRVQLVLSILAEQDIGRGDVVALKGRRDSWLLPTLLGVMAAGAAYLVVPFNSPRAVEEQLCDVVDPCAFVLWDELDVHQDGAMATLPVEQHVQLKVKEGASRSRTLAPRTNQDTAYVCATSGTSGRPKCTAVPHAAVMAFLEGSRAVITLEAEDVIAARSSAAFDLSVWELFAPLLSGSTSVLVPEAVAADVHRLHATMAERRCTVLSTTPSAAYQLGAFDILEGGGLSLRRLLVGGEAGDGARLADIAEAPSFVKCPIDNWYGPTETTVSVSGGRLSRVRLAEVDLTIGPPMPGVGVSLFGDDGVPTDNQEGELTIAGDQLAHGYLGAARETAAAFVPDHDGGRCYRTGDMVRIDASGWITFLGRKDSQVQLRGYRLELSEVQRALSASSGVRWCHAELAGVEGDTLVAWLARWDSSTPLDRTDLFRDLYRRLPRHAVPAALVEVDHVPLTEGQKLDVAQLPKPGASDYILGSVEMVHPENETEQRLLEIWQQLLGMDEISTVAHFFALGGHSLLVARLLSAVRREFNISLSLAETLEHLTVRELAELVVEEKTEEVRGGPPSTE